MPNPKTQPAIALKKIAPIDDVFLALRTPYLGSRIEVTDTQGRTFKLLILSLFHEDNSGRRITISGQSQLMQPPGVKTIGLVFKRYEAYLDYSNTAQPGWLTMID